MRPPLEEAALFFCESNLEGLVVRSGPRRQPPLKPLFRALFMPVRREPHMGREHAPRYLIGFWLHTGRNRLGPALGSARPLASLFAFLAFCTKLREELP